MEKDSGGIMNKVKLVQEITTAQDKLKQQYIKTWDAASTDKVARSKRSRVKTLYCFMQLVLDLLKAVKLNDIILTEDAVYGLDRMLLREQRTTTPE